LPVLQTTLVGRFKFFSRIYGEKQTTFFTVNCAENFESPNQCYPLEGPIGIAYTPNVDSHIPGWQTSEGANGAVIEAGWTWYFILLFQ
jgi:hypothetical protein